jgi:hypothetical protein
LKDAISELQINRKTENIRNLDTNKKAMVKGYQFLTVSVRDKKGEMLP